MSFKVKARIFVFVLGLNLSTISECMKRIGTNDAGPSQSPKLGSEHELLQSSNMDKYRPTSEKGHLILIVSPDTTQFFYNYLL